MKTKAKVPPGFDLNLFLTKGQGKRKRTEYAANAVIFSQGDPADAIFYIHKGKVKLSVFSKQGKEAVVAILGVGDFFGEGCLAGQSSRIGAAIAMSECSIMALARADVVRAIREQPRFAELFVAHLLSRNIRMEGDLVDQLFNSSEKRLARVLLLLASFEKEGTTQAIIPRMSQETLASIVGTTRSRISFFMTRFRKLGYIEYNGGLTVHSTLLNVVLHD